MKRVLITGATGFIGKPCLDKLSSRGYEVHAVSTGIVQVEGSVRWHQANLLEVGVPQAVIEKIKPTHLLHLAWFVKPGQLISAIENYSWVKASFDLVEAFVKGGGQRLVTSGTGYEYDWNYGYCTEDLTPTVPNTTYGACKHALQLMLTAYTNQTAISSAWGRVFFLYGPNEHPQRLVSSVIRSLLVDQPAKCSHGRQIRDYMHVDDVAEGLVALLDSEVTGTFNVSSGQATTIRDLVLTIGRLMQNESLIQIGAIPARPNDTNLVIGDCTRIAERTNWSPHYDLETGLKHTIEWWSQQSLHA